MLRTPDILIDRLTSLASMPATAARVEWYSGEKGKEAKFFTTTKKTHTSKIPKKNRKRRKNQVNEKEVQVLVYAAEKGDRKGEYITGLDRLRLL